MEKKFLSFLVLLLNAVALNAQTSWVGNVSSTWKTASNWTNGVPTSTIDAIIGDANFTGAFQPALIGRRPN